MLPVSKQSHHAGKWMFHQYGSSLIELLIALFLLGLILSHSLQEGITRQRLVYRFGLYAKSLQTAENYREKV